MKNKIQLFEKQQVRTAWDEENEKWWMSVLDVIAILTDQPDYAKVRNYWKWLKGKLKKEGSELVSATNQLKLLAADGKYYKTDVMDTEQFFGCCNLSQVKRLNHLNYGLPKSAMNGSTRCRTLNCLSNRR